MTKQLSKKADLALDNLEVGGGLLTQEQNETFIRRLEDSTTILNAIRTYPMNGPSARINAIGFGEFITYPSNWDPSVNDANHAGRKFKEPYRSRPITTHVELNTKPVKAVVYIPYEVLEDNIERGNLQQTLLTLIANKFAYNMEAMVVRGEQGGNSQYPLLNYIDGIYAQANDHVVNAGGAPLTDAVFIDALKAMPKRYRNDLGTLRFFMGADSELEIRRARSNRYGALGDTFLQGQPNVDVLGVRAGGYGNNPEGQLLLTPPQNLIFGVQRNIRIETDRDIEEELVKIVVTARVAVAIENLDAVVKVTNIGSTL